MQIQKIEEIRSCPIPDSAYAAPFVINSLAHHKPWRYAIAVTANAALAHPWAMYPEAALTLTQGEPKTINSSGTAMRSFCSDCGSGLFYRNEDILPGIVDVQTATLDDPEALPPEIQIQTVERMGWIKHIHELPEFERFPG